MNYYIHTMKHVIDYIEQNITESISLLSISGHFGLSEFHFCRLFKMITGSSVKQYILGRKYAFAVERLRGSDASITDIALDFGFEHVEAFSRAFKKQYGFSPSNYRNEGIVVDLVPKAEIVERDVINYCGVITLKEDFIYLNGFDLYGFYVEVDENDGSFADTLRNTGSDAVKNCGASGSLYAVINCHGDESGKYTVFYGAEQEVVNVGTRNIPAGWYARFVYHGDMLEMRSTFSDDFYRLMIVKEVEPCANGIGMINVFSGEKMHDVKIMVPVKGKK